MPATNAPDAYRGDVTIEPGTPPAGHDLSRADLEGMFEKRLAEAFEALDREAATGNKTIPIDPPTRGSIPAWGSLRERMWHALYV